MKIHYVRLITIISDTEPQHHSHMFMLVPDIIPEVFDIEKAFRDAVKEFLSTEEGQRIVNYNGGDFNWGDAVLNIPDEIWKNHGLIHLESTAVVSVNHDENLYRKISEE